MQAVGGTAIFVCVLLGLALSGCDGHAPHRVAMNHADAHLEAEEYRQAVEQYTAAIDLDPNNAAAYIGRGNAYVDVAEYQAALESYGQALRLDPENVEARRNRGLAYLGLGQLKLAIEDFDEAIRQNIADVPARMARGIAVSQMEALGGAEERSGEFVPTESGDQLTRIQMDDEAVRSLRRYRVRGSRRSQ